MKEKQIRDLAEKIADSLMTRWGRHPTKATRLALMQGLTPYDTHNEQYLGGLCRSSVVSRVTECLTEALSDE